MKIKSFRKLETNLLKNLQVDNIYFNTSPCNSLFFTLRKKGKSYDYIILPRDILSNSDDKSLHKRVLKHIKDIKELNEYSLTYEEKVFLSKSGLGPVELEKEYLFTLSEQRRMREGKVKKEKKKVKRTTGQRVKLIEKKTGKAQIFDNMQLASIAIGKSINYLAMRTKIYGKKENKDYIWELLNE